MMDPDSFIKYVKENELLTGKFEFSRTEDLMDLDFLGKKFVDFTLTGGDYASGSFINCTFERVVFRDLTLVGVGFKNCHFISCQFAHIESDFSMSNCTVDSLTISKNW